MLSCPAETAFMESLENTGATLTSQAAFAPEPSFAAASWVRIEDHGDAAWLAFACGIDDFGMVGTGGSGGFAAQK